MKKLLALSAAVVLSGCGYSSLDSELVGQVKKVAHVTPILCPDYYAVDVSLGVMRNGVGSMSTEDLWLVVPLRVDVELLRVASTSGRIVKVHYDVQRFAICTEKAVVRNVEIQP